jgi:hypothetical protein
MHKSIPLVANAFSSAGLAPVCERSESDEQSEIKGKHARQRIALQVGGTESDLQAQSNNDAVAAKLNGTASMHV